MFDLPPVYFYYVFWDVPCMSKVKKSKTKQKKDHEFSEALYYCIYMKTCVSLTIIFIIIIINNNNISNDNNNINNNNSSEET